MSPEEWLERYVLFLLRPNRSKLVEVVSGAWRRSGAEESDETHVGVEVNCQDLMEFDAELCLATLAYPAALLPIFEQAVREAQERLLRSAVGQSEWRLCPRAHPRLCFVPPLAEHWKANVSALRASDVGPVVQLGGTVVRTGAVKMLETCRVYQCCGCGVEFRVEADREQGNVLEAPTSCGSDAKCQSRKFAEVSRETTDYQELRVQEHVDQLSVGSIPRAVSVLVEDDLADACKAGDDVVVVGRLLRRWQPVHRDVRCDLELTVLALSVRVVGASSSLAAGAVTDDDLAAFRSFWRRRAAAPLAARDVFVSSVCPQICGRTVVKLSVLLTLIGGVEEPGKRRGTPHLLLIGDPGTGKSQVLTFAARAAPRCVLTTGCGTTSAGLTCSAVRDGGEWTLEAGALVLADRGVCCIDEFAAIKEADRATIHEAMEQQTISVAKAGLVCKLSTRASIIAVCNPKGGRYDPHADLSIQTSLPPPLLSRFDIVLVVRDTVDNAWDTQVSTAVLNTSLADGQPPLEAGGESSTLDDDDSRRRTKRARPSSSSSSSDPRATIKRGVVATVDTTSWTIDEIRNYIVHVKDTLRPTIQGTPAKILATYYSNQRTQAGTAGGRATIRMLESLARIAQAHARLMYRSQVEVCDAVIACLLIDKSMGANAIFDASMAVIPDIADDLDSDAYYDIQHRHVLDTLEITDNDNSERQRNGQY